MNSAVGRQAKDELYHKVNKCMGELFSHSGVQKQAYSNGNKVHFSTIKSAKTKRKPYPNMVTLKLINTDSLLVAL